MRDPHANPASRVPSPSGDEERPRGDEIIAPGVTDLAAVVDDLAGSVEDRRTPDEVRRDARTALAIVAGAAVLAVVGVLFDGWWPWAPLALFAGYAILPVTRMLRTGIAPGYRVDSGVIARRVLAASWPATPAVGSSLELRSRVQEVRDRLGTDDEGRVPLLRRFEPFGWAGLGVVTLAGGVWAAWGLDEPGMLPVMVVLAASLAWAARYAHRRNRDIDRAADLLDRLVPPPAEPEP